MYLLVTKYYDYRIFRPKVDFKRTRQRGADWSVQTKQNGRQVIGAVGDRPATLLFLFLFPRLLLDAWLLLLAPGCRRPGSPTMTRECWTGTGFGQVRKASSRHGSVGSV